MNCTHGATAHMRPGDKCGYCGDAVTADEIVAADPMRQATRGEVSGSVDALDGTRSTPREFAVSAPTPATSPQPSLPGRGTPCAEQRHGADTAPSLLDLITIGDTDNANPSPPQASVRGVSDPRGGQEHGAGEPAGDRVGTPGQGALRCEGGDHPTPGGSAHRVPSPSLDLIDATPRARVTDPDTAHQAAGAQAGRLTRDMRIVLAAHVAAGERGLTGPELAVATRRTYEQIGPRRKPLEVAGLVEKAERRPKDPTQPTGSLVWAYRITDLGRDTYAREQARSNAA